MMVGRIVAGLGTGANTATAGVWQAETSKMNSRGKLVIIQMANCITGFSLSNWLTLGFSFAPGSVDWRFPIAFQLFFVIVLFAMCPFLPDSPRLLIRKGKYDEAREVIAALQGDGATPEDPRVKTQFNVIKDILDREHMNTYSWWKLLSGRGPSGVLRRMILGAWMQAMNQISGINVTSYYMTSIYNIGCFIGAMSTIFTGDKLGRPRQVMLGTFVIGIGAIIQTASYTVAQMMVGRIVAGLGTGANTATAGVWQAETSKMNSRGKLVIIQMANCITGFSLSNWLTLGFSFAPGSVDWRFPIAFQLFFVIVLFAMCPFLPDSPRLLIPITYFFYPETANRT